MQEENENLKDDVAVGPKEYQELLNNFDKIDTLTKRLVVALSSKTPDPAVKTQPSQELYYKASAKYFSEILSNPTKLIEVVEIGKQLLMTRGSLTTFSISNDVAKYFAILPALFSGIYVLDGKTSGPLSHLDIMHLVSPHSAILSSIIFNALIIIALIPLALKGVNYQAQSASTLLRKNLLIYGVGGLICPFIGIKVIDIIINSLGIV